MAHNVVKTRKSCRCCVTWMVLLNNLAKRCSLLPAKFQHLRKGTRGEGEDTDFKREEELFAVMENIFSQELRDTSALSWNKIMYKQQWQNAIPIDEEERMVVICVHFYLGPQ